MKNAIFMIMLSVVMISHGAAQAQEDFDEVYAAWREYVIREDMPEAWHLAGPEAAALIALGPGIMDRIFDKIEEEPAPDSGFEAYQIQRGLQWLLRILTGIRLERVWAADVSPSALAENRLIARTLDAAYFQRQAAEYEQRYGRYLARLNSGEPVSQNLRMRALDAHLNGIWRDGIYALPFMVRKIIEDNRSEFFLIIQPTLDRFGIYNEYADGYTNLFTTKEEKLEYIRSAWRNEMKERFESFDEVVAELSDLLEKPSSAVYGYAWLSIGNNADIRGGVGVRDAADPSAVPEGEAELVISNGAVIEGNVFAHRVVMGNGARVEGVVAADELTTGAQSVVTLGWRSPVHLPVIDPFPHRPDFVSGGAAVEVKNNKTHQLLSGSYGATELGNKSRLVLVGGGDYLFDSFEADNNAEVLVLTPARLLVSGRFSAGNGFTIQFPDTSDLTAEDCFLYIRGENADPADIRSRPAAVELGNNTSMRAHLVAPFGTIRTGNDLELHGAISGLAVDIGNNSTIIRE